MALFRSQAAVASNQRQTIRQSVAALEHLLFLCYGWACTTLPSTSTSHALRHRLYGVHKRLLLPGASRVLRPSLKVNIFIVSNKSAIPFSTSLSNLISNTAYKLCAGINAAQDLGHFKEKGIYIYTFGKSSQTLKLTRT